MVDGALFALVASDLGVRDEHWHLSGLHLMLLLVGETGLAVTFHFGRAHSELIFATLHDEKEPTEAELASCYGRRCLDQRG